MPVCNNENVTFGVQRLVCRYERYLKSGCVDMESFIQRENTHNISIEEEMENIDALKAPTFKKKDETLSIDYKASEHNTKYRKEDEKPENDTKEDDDDNKDFVIDEEEIIINSASPSVNISAEDPTSQEIKRISIRSIRQNFFSFKYFSTKH